MTIDDKIRDEKLQMILREKQQKYQQYHLEKLKNMNILQVKKYYLPIKEEGQNKLSLLILLQKKLWKNKRQQLKVKVKSK